MNKLEARAIPKAYYEQIPQQPLKLQLKTGARGDAKVHDFPWVMNFIPAPSFC